MKLPFVIILVVAIYNLSNSSISMMGVSINDSKSEVLTNSLKVIVADSNKIIFETKDHNNLILTFRNDKIIQIENDWSQSHFSTTPLYTDFIFGKTTLSDIKGQFGTSGFQYNSMSNLKYMGDTISCNCFEFKSEKKEVLVLLTRTKLINKYNRYLSDSLKLDKVILADYAYLNEIWGKEKAYDINYKYIDP